MTKTELLEIARNTKIGIVMKNHSIYEIVFNLCDRYGAEVIEAAAHNFIGFIPGQQRPDESEKAGTMSDIKLTPMEKFNNTTDNLAYDIMAWLDDDEMVLDGRYTFENLTIIYKAWVQYREDCEEAGQ